MVPRPRWIATLLKTLSVICALSIGAGGRANVGVGAAPVVGAEMLIDGTRETLDAKWTYWAGPAFASALPIKWQIVDDPVDRGTVLMSFDPVATEGTYGRADIVTKKEYRDFRLHVEFLVMQPRGNSGVYLQNRYEIQIANGDTTKHGTGAVINEAAPAHDAYRGLKTWNAYDIVFRAARFKDSRKVEPAMLTMYFNAVKVHRNQPVMQVWGGPNSGIDGGNDGGKGITDTPGGLKLQAGGFDVRFRNTWIKELAIEQPDTDFSE
jgi:hypothetical protein